MNAPRSRGILIALVVAVFSLLAAALCYFRPFAFPDEFEYWILAQNLAHTGRLTFNGVDPSAYRPPLVTWVLTPLAALHLPLAVARPLFVLFYAATGALAGVLLCRVFVTSLWLPALGVAFVLSHPLYFFAAGNLYPQEILAPLLLAALVLACHHPISTRGAVWRSVGIGLLTGASLLATAPAVFSLAPIFLLLALEDYGSLRALGWSQSFRVLLAVVAMAACVAPYVLRNARHVHPGLYLSLNSGINLLFGNSPDTTPASGVNLDLSRYSVGTPGESEFDANRRLTDVALTNIRRDPSHYAKLYFRKFLGGFSNVVDTLTHGRDWRATLVLEAYMLLTWLGVGILLYQLVIDREGRALSLDRPFVRSFLVLVLAGYLLSLAGYAVFFIRLRFRLPVDLALALAAAIGWLSLWKSRSRKATV